MWAELFSYAGGAASYALAIYYAARPSTAEPAGCRRVQVRLSLHAAREWARMQEEARLRRLAQRQEAYMSSFRDACDESDMAHVVNFRWGPATGFIDTANGARARSAKARAQRQKNKLKQKKTVKKDTNARARTLGAFSSCPVCR